MTPADWRAQSIRLRRERRERRVRLETTLEVTRQALQQAYKTFLAARQELEEDQKRERQSGNPKYL